MYYLPKNGVLVNQRMSDEVFKSLSSAEKSEVSLGLTAEGFRDEYGFYPHNFYPEEIALREYAIQMIKDCDIEEMSKVIKRELAAYNEIKDRKYPELNMEEVLCIT